MADPQGADERLARLRERWEQEGDSRVFLQLAEEYRKTGRLEEAAEVLQKGLDRHPNHVSAWVALGRCRLELGEPDEAKTAFEKVLLSDPTQLVASKLMVETELARGQGKEAARKLEHYILLNPQDRDVEELRIRVDALLPPGEPSGIVTIPLDIGGNGQTLFPWLESASQSKEILASWPPRRELREREDTSDRGDELFALRVAGVAAGDPFSWIALDQGLPVPIAEPLPLVDHEAAIEEPEAEAEPFVAEAAIEEPEAEAEPFVAEAAIEEPEAEAEPFVDETVVEEPEAEAEPFVAEAATEEPEAEAEEDVPAESWPEAAPVDGSPPATATLGQLYLRQGHLQEAAQIFEEVLSRDPGNAIALEGLDEIEARREEPLTAVDILKGEDLAGLGLSARKILMLQRYQERLRAGEGGDVS